MRNLDKMPSDVPDRAQSLREEYATRESMALALVDDEIDGDDVVTRFPEENDNETVFFLADQIRLQRKYPTIESIVDDYRGGLVDDTIVKLCFPLDEDQEKTLLLANERNERDWLEEADKLLERFPEDLQQVWLDKTSHLNPLEQRNALKAAIEKRNNLASEEKAVLLPYGVEVFESFPDDVKEMIEVVRSSKETIEVGYGQAGHVLTSPSQEGVCYKILLADEVLPPATNDIAEETDLQHRICEEFDGLHGVRVPKVFAFIHEDGTRAITMELLNAPSLRGIIEKNKEEMPEAFDEATFFKALELFMKAMHEKGYYHRDLHAGNILVDRETGMPCVIDFGLSAHRPLGEEGAYREDFYEDGQKKEIVFKYDFNYLEEVKRAVYTYVRKMGDA